MKQVFCVRSNSALITSGTRYSNIGHTLSFGSTEADTQSTWPCAGVFSNLIITLDVAPGAGGSGKGYTFTLRKNGADTSLTVTIMETATTARDVSHTVTVAPGDLLTLSSLAIASPTSPGTRGVVMSLEHTGTVVGESGYAISPTNLSTSATVRNGVFAQWVWVTSAGTVVQNVVAAAGVIDKLYIRLNGLPGAGKTYTFNIYKNGVKQDGTGGTANTTVTIDNASATGNASFSLALVGGDVVYLECVPSGTPTLRAGAASVKFTATTDGQSQMCGWHDANMNVTNPSFTWPQTFGGDGNWSTSETPQCVNGSLTTFTLSKLYVVTPAGSPGSGKSYTLSMRKNATSPAGTPSAVIADTATTGSDLAGTIDIADGDTWTIRSTPSGTPTARAAAWALIQGPDNGETPPEDEPTVTIAGVLTPIKKGTIDISEISNGRNTFTCDVVSIGGALRYDVDDEVVVWLNNVRAFAGTIDKTIERGAGDLGIADLFIRVNVNDFNSLADRRFIQTTFAGGTLKSMLTTMVTYLSTFGVTLHPSQVNGPTLAALTYDYKQATEILNDWATLSGYVWEIDYDKQLQMYNPGTVSAPFDVTTANRRAIGDVQVEHNAKESYANRIILRYGSNQLVEKSDDFTGDGVATSFTLTYTPVARADPYTAFYGYVTNNAVNETLGVGANWTFNTGTNAITDTTGAPTNGNPINIKYLVQFPETVIVNDTASQPPILERFIEEPDVFDVAVATALANAELAKALEQLTTVRYTTRGVGIKPGQTQTITIAARNINATYLITDVRSHDDADNKLRRYVTAVQGTTLRPTWRETYKQWSGVGSATAPVAP
jgi:hypothetical protein